VGTGDLTLRLQRNEILCRTNLYTEAQCGVAESQLRAAKQGLALHCLVHGEEAGEIDRECKATQEHSADPNVYGESLCWPHSCEGLEFFSKTTIKNK